jgi:two-component system sensor histidine kinase EvgS
VVDLLTATARTPERAAGFDFTEPYYAAPMAIIMRSDAPFWQGLRDLHGRNVAAPRAYVTTTMIERDHREIRIRYTETSAQALRLVSRGDADAVIDNLVTASRLMRDEGLGNLKIVGIVEPGFELRFAVPKGRYELVSILNKALESVGEDEKFRLHDKWIAINTEDAVNWPLIRRLVLWFAATGGLVLTVILIWNRRLARELTARLAAEAKLRALNDEKDAMMGMLAHDLRNPLNTVSLSCSALQPSVEQAPAVAIIRRNVERMTQLIARVLSSNAIESGKFQARATAFSLSANVGEVVAGCRPAAAAKGITLDFLNHAGTALVRADTTAATQIADNLISNALKFTPPGGMVAVSLARHDGRIQLSVRDTGPGIRADEKDRLFVKFARLSARPTADEPTHGLGLSIVKKLSDAIGADIGVESKPGEGAEFRVSFAACEKAKEPQMGVKQGSVVNLVLPSFPSSPRSE